MNVKEFIIEFLKIKRFKRTIVEQLLKKYTKECLIALYQQKFYEIKIFEKENSVVYKFAERSLEKSLLDTINDECKAYEKKHGNTRVKKLEALEKLEKKYL